MEQSLRDFNSDYYEVLVESVELNGHRGDLSTAQYTATYLPVLSSPY